MGQLYPKNKKRVEFFVGLFCCCTEAVVILLGLLLKNKGFSGWRTGKEKDWEGVLLGRCIIFVELVQTG